MNLNILEVKVGDRRRPVANTTNHPQRFTDGRPGFLYCPPSGAVLEAEKTEYHYGTVDGIRLVRPVFSPKPETLEKIEKMKAAYPGLIILGSRIQTEVYSRDVWGPRPLATSLPSGENARLMRLDEFNYYDGRCPACGRWEEKNDQAAVVSSC